MFARSISLAAACVAVLGLTPAPPEPEPIPVDVVLTEGTNMAVDVSPDGGTLAIDLVGRIWTLPAGGGTATPITDPFGDARQPRWSPDGTRIAFQAYWAGDYDVWVVNRDGSGLMQLTSGPYDDREPAWAADGASVLFSSDRGGSYDVWRADVGSGALTRETNSPGNEYMPSPSPDGRSLAWIADGAESGVWIEDERAQPRRIVTLDGWTGYGASWAPDGASLAYVRIGNGEAALHVVSAEGGEGLGRQITPRGADVFPFRASWTNGDRFFFTMNGRIHQGSANRGVTGDVPFAGTVTLHRDPYRKALRSFDDDGPQLVQGIVSPSMSPDGEHVAFSALGDLWVMRIGNTPERVTDDAFVEVDAAWSPDGTQLAYATDRGGFTNVWVRDMATGLERQITSEGGSMPAWAPDGRSLAFLTGGFGTGAGVAMADVATGATRMVRSGLNGPGRPTWAPDGRSIAVSALRTYSSRFREGVNHPLLIPVRSTVFEQEDPAPRPRPSFALGSGPISHAGHFHGLGLSGEAAPVPVRLQEGERWLDFATHGSFASRGTDGPVWSADGRRMAYVASGVLWTVRVGADGEPEGAPRRVNNERSSDPSWDGAGRSILYLGPDGLRRVWIDSGRIEDVEVDLTWRRAEPDEVVVIRAGGLFDGVSSEIRRNVDIVVRGNRIVRVGPRSADPPAGRVIDASDGIVMPGLIEMHMHGGLGVGQHVGRQWLAYGVTSIRTPSADPWEMVEAREADAVGRRPEPRMFGTGNTIDGSRIYYGGAPALTSSGQVELEMAQADALGFDVMKTYVRLSDAVQRRVIEDSHALGMPLTSHELYPAVAYGMDGVEHVKGTSRRGYSTKVSELNRSYQDVVELLSRSGMTLTPTIGIYGAYSLLTEEDPSIFDDPRVENFIPWAPGAGGQGGNLEVRRQMVRDMASLGRRVVEAGGTVVVGTDSPIIPPGIALIAEMQALVEYGGMAEIDVLRATTSVSADAMGYGELLGSVREGMLADLIVLGANPLNDIRALRDVRWVIENGVVRSAEELLRGPM
ncbi:MAG: amidohydrolase family protein [Gemmatimonadota bacterium]